VINFEDAATQWFENLSAAVSAQPQEIEVQFVGGCVTPPHEIIALRNALLGIPGSIRLVTTALASLPPLTCAAWLVGDERRIAKDAVVWIPEVPEDILRNGLRRPHPALSERGGKKARGAEEDVRVDEGEPEDEDEDDAEDDVPFGRPRTNTGGQRCERDLRALADVVNEWFPCWEFKGSCLTFDDLVVWDVVKPEWCFGGRGVRNRPEALAKAGRAGVRAKESRALGEMEPAGTTDVQKPVNCGQVELAGEKPGQNIKGEHAASKDAPGGSESASEPHSAAKPSDL
jgi:hypothetical protein